MRVLCLMELVTLHLAGWIALLLIGADLFDRKVVPDGFEFLAEADGKREADVSKSDDADG